MNIRNTKEIKSFARERLQQTPAAKKIIWIYEGILIAMSMAVMAGQYLLDTQIAKTGGLGSMDLRSTLTAVQTMLPILQTGISMCIGLGYLGAMMRTARGQYVSPNTLRLGFDRFWPLLWLTLIEVLIYTGAGVVSLYAATAIFVVTPLSRKAMALLMPLIEEASALNPTLLLDDALYSQLMSAMQPVIYLFLALLCVIVLPIMLRYRMARYILVDKPGMGAMGVLRESRKMMRGNCWNLVRLDLSFWWYYLGVMLVSLVGYADQLLPLVGITIPGPAEAGYYGSMILSYVLSFILCVNLQNRVEAAYALAYDTIAPKEEPGKSVVLGNIFQM